MRNAIAIVYHLIQLLFFAIHYNFSDRQGLGRFYVGLLLFRWGWCDLA